MRQFLIVLYLLVVVGSVRCEPPATRKLSPADAERVEALVKRIEALSAEGKHGEAVGPAEELAALRTRAQGPLHWETVSAQATLEAIKKLAALPAAAQLEFAKAGALTNEAVKLLEKGEYAQAIEKLKTANEICQRLLGDHPETANSCSNLGALLRADGRTAQAIGCYEKAVAIHRAIFGEEHPDTAMSWNNLAAGLDSLGRYAEAELLMRRSLAVRRRLIPDDHAALAVSCNNVAHLLDAQGKFAAAEPWYREALAGFQKEYGENHADTIATYSNLASNLDSQGRYAEAEELCTRVLAAREKLLGADHPETAVSQNMLGVVLSKQKKYADAQRHLEKALATRRRALGEDHPETTNSCGNLGSVLDSQGLFAQAQPYHEKALAVRRRTLGTHADTATTQHNFADNLLLQGKLDEARPHFEQALAARLELLGEDHPDTVATRVELGHLASLQRRQADAETVFRAAVKSYEIARQRISASGLGRATFAAEHSPRVPFAACLARSGKYEEAWQVLERDLARGLLDEWSAQVLQPLDADILARRTSLEKQLGELEAQLLSLGDHQEPLEVLRRKLKELSKKRGDVEAALAQLAADHSVIQVFALERIQRQLREDAALVAWVDVSRRLKSVEASEHWACIITSRGAPTFLPLLGSGPGKAWTKADDELPHKVRQFLCEPVNLGSDWLEPARQLYEQRLAPLASFWNSPNPIRRLIILPSPVMAGIPIEALLQAGQVEHLIVSYAPSGTLYARLNESKPESRKGRTQPLTLLALGDPDYAASEAAGSRFSASPGDRKLQRLPQTRFEVEAIAALFPKPTTLLGSDASLVRLRSLGGELSRYDVLHLAAHGASNSRRALDSALILSGTADQSDARLTASEIGRTWKLNADLVVLSACETGLGQSAGGEGYLGFSQPLFLAGARSLILSQWPVSDAATALLMVRFYENWLGTSGRPPMTKSEALREAKGWLRQLSSEQVRQRLADLPERARGLQLESRGPNPLSSSERPFAHPYYWSAFILIGNPN